MSSLVVKFNEDYRGFKKDQVIEFENSMSFLVGDQGSGKTTLLEAISNRNGRKIAEITLPDAYKKIVHHDFEKDNVRTAAHFGEGDMKTQVEMMWVSHGQSVALMLRGIHKQLSEPSIILLDEPDNGLSVKTIRALMIFLGRLIDQGHFVIASIHNPLLYMYAEDRKVFDVQKREWVFGKAYFDRLMSEPI